MHKHGGAKKIAAAAYRPSVEVGDVFRAHGEAYRLSRKVSSDQLRVMKDIETCRTAELGGHLDQCDHCGHQVPSYNSCRNRHCPKCQGLNQARWIAKRKERIIPTPYFHLVFTLPAQLRALAMCNREKIFGMLFTAAASTLLTLGWDPKRLGGLVGITAVLHTWTRKLEFHPHLHCIVTGGGLIESTGTWTGVERDFLFPVEVISELFSGKFLHALNREYKKGRLEFAGGASDLASESAFNRLKDKLYRKKWVVYAKCPFGGPEQVFEYLGRYTHRVAISNQRLIKMDEREVTFYTKNGKTHSLPHREFIRRFLLHILPKGFFKIRHYGLMSSTNVKTKLQAAKEILEQEAHIREITPQETVSADANWQELTKILTGIDLTVCPHCGQGNMIRIPMSAEGIALTQTEIEDTS